MTAYPLRDTYPEDVNHVNHDLILNGHAPELGERALKSVRTPEVKSPTARFTIVWNSLREALQDPMYDGEEGISGYTGHRVVTLDESGDQFALGFQLFSNFPVKHKNATLRITAHWRRIHAADVRLENYESDSCSIQDSELYVYPKVLAKVEQLYDVFQQAPVIE